MKYLLLTTLCAFWACQKSDVAYKSGADEPVFSLSIREEGPPVSYGYFTAGYWDTYLFTGFEDDPLGVRSFYGAFSNAECPQANCGRSARFVFRDVKANTLDNTPPDPQKLFLPNFPIWQLRSPASDSLALGTVAITWVKPNGRSLLSHLAEQNSASFFKILRAEPWEPNEKGQATWKMDIEFSCMALDTAAMQAKKISGTGTIAVAYR